jgi:D-alanyl-D-alanine carboxypeptidase
MIRKSILAILSLATLILVIGLISPVRLPASPAGGPASPSLPFYSSNSFDEKKIEARAIYVYDLVSQKPLFSLNAESQLPLASLAKLMTAVVAREILPADAIVAVSKEAVLQEGDVGLVVGERLIPKDLIDIMLVGSSNDAAYALAEAVEQIVGRATSDIMNQKADEIGLEQTYFLGPTGLDISNNLSGAYGSARDVSLLMEYILYKYPSLLEATRHESIAVSSVDGSITHQIKNTNQSLPFISQLIASKTGFTDLAGGNVVIVFDAGLQHPVIVVVLGSSEEGRFKDLEAIYKIIIDKWV